MPRAYSVLLAEPNPLLREKLAGVLTRSAAFWCVIQVENAESLARAAVQMQPDFIMADLTVFKDKDLHGFLRKNCSDSRIIGLVDTKLAPYVKAGADLCLDAIFERGHMIEEILDLIAFVRNPHESQQ